MIQAEQTLKVDDPVAAFIAAEEARSLADEERLARRLSAVNASTSVGALATLKGEVEALRAERELLARLVAAVSL